MIPIIYPANETEYTSHGIGSIPDAESCLVTEGDDTRYELRMTVPVTGFISLMRSISSPKNSTRMALSFQ